MKRVCVPAGLCFMLATAVIGQGNWQDAALSEREMFFEAGGTVRPKMVTTLSSKVMGNVLEVLKREGDVVKEGDLLVRIDSSDLASDLAGARAGLSEASAMAGEVEKGIQAAIAQKDQAAAALRLAQASFDRVNSLFEKKSAGKAELDQAQAGLASALAQMKSAEAQISALEARRSGVSARMGHAQAGVSKARTFRNLAEVTAPFSGKVTARRIEPGMLAAPGVPLMVIEDDGRLQVEASVPESLIASITEGQAVEVAIDALAASRFPGKVAEIAPSGDALSHTFLVKIAISNDPRIRSGMYARAWFPRGLERILLVPAAAVETRGQLEGIRVRRNGRAVFVLIRTGRSFGDQVEVLSGLAPGDAFLPRPFPEGSETR